MLRVALLLLSRSSCCCTRRCHKGVQFTYLNAFILHCCYYQAAVAAGMRHCNYHCAATSRFECSKTCIATTIRQLLLLIHVNATIIVQLLIVFNTIVEHHCFYRAAVAAVQTYCRYHCAAEHLTIFYSCCCWRALLPPTCS